MKNDPFPTDADIVKRLRQIVAEPQKWCSTDVDYVDDAADAIARLTAERDEARREVCGWAGQARNLDPNVIAMQRGWNVKVKHEPDARHDRPEEVVVVKVGRHRVRELKR